MVVMLDALYFMAESKVRQWHAPVVVARDIRNTNTLVVCTGNAYCCGVCTPTVRTCAMRARRWRAPGAVRICSCEAVHNTGMLVTGTRDSVY